MFGICNRACSFTTVAALLLPLHHSLARMVLSASRAFRGSINSWGHVILAMKPTLCMTCWYTDLWGRVCSFTTVVVVSALLLPLNYWLAAWVGGLTVYYLLTVPGEPEHNGAPCVLSVSTRDRFGLGALHLLRDDMPTLFQSVHIMRCFMWQDKGGAHV